MSEESEPHRCNDEQATGDRHPFHSRDRKRWVSRRDVLSGAAVAGALSMAGCPSDDSPAEDTPTDSPTEASTQIPSPTPRETGPTPTLRDVEPTGDSVTLVEDGEPGATIMIETDPLNVTKQAITDLRDYVEKMTGARLPTAAPGETVETDHYLWVGNHPELETILPEEELEFGEYEESIVAARGGHLAIVGADGPDEWGTKQAVYTFLQEYLDVRWLWPGALGEDVPERDSIAFDPFTDRHVPGLEQRVLRGPSILKWHAVYNDIPGIDNDEQFGKRRQRAAARWNRRNRNTPRWFRVGHSFKEWWDEYGEDHRLYFALDPSGYRHPSGEVEHTKLCVSNPDVADQWVRNKTAELDDDPTKRVLSASPNDGRFVGYCVCDDGEHETNGDCRGWDPDPADAPTVELRWSNTKKEFVALTDRYSRFWNRLARRLREQLPNHDHTVGAWAYGPYRTPPVEVDLHEDVGIGYVGNGMSEALPSTRQRDRTEWDGWSQRVGTLLWRPNLFHHRPGIPSLFMHRSAADLQYMTERNLAGFEIDRCYHHWATQGLQYYVFMQLAWDPSREVDTIIEEWVTRAVGEAAAPNLREYVDLLESATNNLNEQVGSYADGTPETAYPKYSDVFDEGFFEKAWSLIEDMRSAVEGERHSERVEFFAAGLEFTEIQMTVIDALKSYDFEEARQAANRRQAFLEEHIDSWAISRIMLHNQRGWAEQSGVVFPP